MKRFFSFTYEKTSRKQLAVFIALLLLTAVFSMLVCAASIDGRGWTYDYPLPGSVDDYGCYPQMFDAFKKGQLNIDTDYDLSRYEALENPYDTAKRRAATGETFGVTWDRAYFDGKLYSYFGIAPVVFLYFPFYFLTGRVLSDALAAAIITALAAIFLMTLFRVLIGRLPYKVPCVLFFAGEITLPFGALLWSTSTCANFYHIAVLAGICSVGGAFLFLVCAEQSRGFIRKALFVLSGICSVCVIGTRPNQVLYLLAALPIIICLIAKRPNGTKSLIGDALSYAVPAVALGVLLMIYNASRFGSPFDFGNDYQLTLWDMSTMTFSFALIPAALFHYFVHPPLADGEFPFLHPTSAKLGHYVQGRRVYISGNVGALFIPCVYGLLYLPYSLRGCGKKAFWSVLAAGAAVLAIAITDMSYAGVHLRYEADIMYVLAFGGIFGFVAAAGRLYDSCKKTAFGAMTAVALVAFLLTVAVDTALCFDNERDMIKNYHNEIYSFFAGIFGK